MEGIMPTAREFADRVREARKGAWEKSDPTVAIVSTKQVNPDDERVVRRIVADAGLKGEELEQMVQQVATIIVRQVEAQDDDMPVDGGD